MTVTYKTILRAFLPVDRLGMALFLRHYCQQCFLLEDVQELQPHMCGPHCSQQTAKTSAHLTR